MNPKKSHRNKRQAVGADMEDFEVDIVHVRIRKTWPCRLKDAAWTVTATIFAVTVATVFIIPMFG